MKKLTKEEIGYKPTDPLFKMLLCNPHDHHFWYQRSDGTIYGYSHIKDEPDGIDEWFWEVDGYQMELKLDINT